MILHSHLINALGCNVVVARDEDEVYSKLKCGQPFDALLLVRGQVSTSGTVVSD